MTHGKYLFFPMTFNEFFLLFYLCEKQMANRAFIIAMSLTYTKSYLNRRNS